LPENLIPQFLFGCLLLGDLMSEMVFIGFDLTSIYPWLVLLLDILMLVSAILCRLQL
jgi:hypothetical protein